MLCSVNYSVILIFITFRDNCMLSIFQFNRQNCTLGNRFHSEIAKLSQFLNWNNFLIRGILELFQENI